MVKRTDQASGGRANGEPYKLRTDLDIKSFPDCVRLFVGEGGAVYTAERDGKFYLITSEGELADYLTDEEAADIDFESVREFETALDRSTYARGQGWLPDVE